MNTLAFLLDGEWRAADLITPGYLMVPLIVTSVCWYLIVKSRRYVSYAMGIAAVPAACVLARLFWATIQFDLRDYPTEQIMIALVVAFFPFTAIGALVLWPRKRPNQPTPAQRP